jgi:adenylate cyclase
MADAAHADIADWVTAAGLAGKSEAVLLEGFCRKVLAAGVPVARAAVIVDTLHPVHEGRAFRWNRDTAEGPDMIEYGPTNEGEAAANWQASAHYHLVQTGRCCGYRSLPARRPSTTWSSRLPTRG